MMERLDKHTLVMLNKGLKQQIKDLNDYHDTRTMKELKETIDEAEMFLKRLLEKIIQATKDEGYYIYKKIDALDMIEKFLKKFKRGL